MTGLGGKWIRTGSGQPMGDAPKEEERKAALWRMRAVVSAKGICSEDPEDVFG